MIYADPFINLIFKNSSSFPTLGFFPLDFIILKQHAQNPALYNHFQGTEKRKGRDDKQFFLSAEWEVRTMRNHSWAINSQLQPLPHPSLITPLISELHSCCNTCCDLPWEFMLLGPQWDRQVEYSFKDKRTREREQSPPSLMPISLVHWSMPPLHASPLLESPSAP